MRGGEKVRGGVYGVRCAVCSAVATQSSAHGGARGDCGGRRGSGSRLLVALPVLLDCPAKESAQSAAGSTMGRCSAVQCNRQRGHLSVVVGGRCCLAYATVSCRVSCLVLV